MVNPKHHVVIEYCVPWDYSEQAVRAAAEVIEGWAPVLVSVELRSGTHGVFRTSVDGEVVHDRKERRSLPAPGELTELIAAKLGPPLRWRGHA